MTGACYGLNDVRRRNSIYVRQHRHLPHLPTRRSHRHLHYNSARAGGPFVELNAAAIPETLVESELFGHERGAFSDARERKLGLVEVADGGTLFLDEVGDLSSAPQAKLLTFLESLTF